MPSEDVEKIVAFVPVCKEKLEQVEQTIDSLIFNKLGSNYLLTTVISDGHNDYSDVFTSITKKVEAVATPVVKQVANDDSDESDDEPVVVQKKTVQVDSDSDEEVVVQKTKTVVVESDSDEEEEPAPKKPAPKKVTTKSKAK